MIAMLEPIFTGDWAPLGEALICAATPPTNSLPVAALLHEPDRLDEVLRRHARHLGVFDGDLRAVASTWSLAYLDMLLPTLVAAASVLQHGLPAHAERMSVLLDDDATPQGFYILDEGQSLQGVDTATRFEPLLAGHLAPLFAAISRHTRLANKILWGNLARILDTLFDHALQLTGNAPHVAQDRDHLLQRRHWHGGSANPLHGSQRVVAAPGTAVPIKLHRQCCLCYLLPGQDYCSACPLAPHHQPVSASTRPASAHSV